MSGMRQASSRSADRVEGKLMSRAVAGHAASIGVSGGRSLTMLQAMTGPITLMVQELGS